MTEYFTKETSQRQRTANLTDFLQVIVQVAEFPGHTGFMTVIADVDESSRGHVGPVTPERQADGSSRIFMRIVTGRTLHALLPIEGNVA